MGWGLTAVAVFTGPYFLLNGLGLIENKEKNLLTVSLGEKNLKQLAVQLNAGLPRNIVFSSDAAIRIFDKYLPSSAGYAAGAGYKIHLSEWLTLTPLIKVSVRGYEGYEPTLISAQGGAELFYDYSEQIKFGAEIKEIFGSEPLREMNFSIHKIYRGKALTSGSFARISYEEDDFIRTRIYYLSLGLSF
jgi:hypothetical protein